MGAGAPGAARRIEALAVPGARTVRRNRLVARFPPFRLHSGVLSTGILVIPD